MIAKVLIVCSVLLLSLCGVTSAFNCDDTLYQTYDALRQCLESEPYNSTIKDQTLTTLQMIMPSYVFIDSSLNSADPVHIPMNVNLTAELENVANSNYANDVELQEAIANVFTLVQDAHTHYLKPRVPYVASSFVMPFVFYSRVEGSPLKQNIYLRWNEQLLTVYTNLYGQTLVSNPQNDLLVLTIDGSDPVTNIGNFANTSVGYTKDYSARFNLAIDGYGGDFPAMYTWRNQSLQGMPTTGSLQLSVQDTVSKQTSDLSVSWIGVYDPYFNVSFVEEAGANSLVGVHVFEFLDRAYGIDRYNDFEEPSGNPDVYYSTIQPDVGVLRIYTFAPKNRTDFIKTIEEAMCTFASSGVTKLILDLSQNGGGDICLGYAVENFLFPNLAPITGAYDIKASDLFRAFADAGSDLLCSPGGTVNDTLQFCGTNPELAGYFTPCAWFDWFSKEEYYDESWFVPGNYAVRGGVGDYYSSFVTQGCAAEFTMWIPGQTTGWTLDPANVIIVSDGLCGSTCAVFSRHLQLKHRVKAVTTGGVYGGQQPSFTSFPGGEVVHMKYIHILAEQYGLTDSPLVPPPLPTDADFRFAIREIFGWDDIGLNSDPQEFTYVPADWQIFYQNTFQNHTSIWNQVLGFFDICATWETRPCDIANGLGEYRCVNGVLDTSNCVITQCNPGYTFDLQENICTPCGYGFYKTGFDLGGCVLCPNILPGNCDYSQDAVTAPSCPFSCSECQECTQTQDDGINSNTVCLQTWAFCLLIVLVVVLSFAISTVVSCLVTRKYYLKKAAATYAPLNQDFDDE